MYFHTKQITGLLDSFEKYKVGINFAAILIRRKGLANFQITFSWIDEKTESTEQTTNPQSGDKQEFADSKKKKCHCLLSWGKCCGMPC